MDTEQPVLVFDDSVKEKIIKAVGYDKNKDSEVVDDRGKVATSQNFERITADNFGGVLMGSKIPIKNEESELVKYFTSK